MTPPEDRLCERAPAPSIPLPLLLRISISDCCGKVAVQEEEMMLFQSSSLGPDKGYCSDSSWHNPRIYESYEMNVTRMFSKIWDPVSAVTVSALAERFTFKDDCDSTVPVSASDVDYAESSSSPLLPRDDRSLLKLFFSPCVVFWVGFASYWPDTDQSLHSIQC